MLHEYLTLSIGLLLILLSIIILVFPPKFGNQFYGVCTPLTLKNAAIWTYGQKLFSISILCIGFIFCILGSFGIPNKIPDVAMFGILVALWTLSKFIVHRILSLKFSLWQKATNAQHIGIKRNAAQRSFDLISRYLSGLNKASVAGLFVSPP